MSNVELKLKNVRLAFPALFKPKAFEAGDEPKYSANLLIPKDDPQVASIKAAVKQAATEMWGAKAEQVLASISSDKRCLRDGDAKKHLEGYEGMYYLNAKNARRPTVYDRDKSPILEDNGRVYAGCYVNVKLSIYAMKHPKGGCMVNPSLAGVQFSKDGDAFSGGAAASADDFDLVEGTDDDMI